MLFLASTQEFGSHRIAIYLVASYEASRGLDPDLALILTIATAPSGAVFMCSADQQFALPSVATLGSMGYNGIYHFNE